jgi:hypothetical protein
MPLLGVMKMVEPQTVSQVIEQLSKEGYTQDFKAHNQNLLVIPRNIEIEPEQIIVDKIYRFEGETDLSDEAIIFALSCPQHNVKGTYLVAFGPMMDSQDAEIVQRFNDRYEKRQLNSNLSRSK